MARYPRAGIEEQLQGPAVTATLVQAAVTVCMAVDQSWNDQSVCRIDDPGFRRPAETRGRHRLDCIALDQDIRRACTRLSVVHDQAVGDESEFHAVLRGSGFSGQCTCVFENMSVPGPISVLAHFFSYYWEGCKVGPVAIGQLGMVNDQGMISDDR